MTTDIRDPQFAFQVASIAESIRWPDAAFTLTPIEVLAGVLVAFYEAFATPDPVTLQHALRGIAF